MRSTERDTSSEARIGSMRRSISASECPTSTNAYIAAPATSAETAPMPKMTIRSRAPTPLTLVRLFGKL